MINIPKMARNEKVNKAEQAPREQFSFIYMLTYIYKCAA